MLSQGLKKYFSPLRYNPGMPPSFPDLLTLPSPSWLPPTPCLSFALCGNFPQNTVFSPNFLPLKTPGISFCHPSRWHRPGHTSQGSSLLSMKPKQSHTQHRAAGCTLRNNLTPRTRAFTYWRWQIPYFSKNSLTYLRKNRSSNYQQGLCPEGYRRTFHNEVCAEMCWKFVFWHLKLSGEAPCSKEPVLQALSCAAQSQKKKKSFPASASL